MRSNAAFFNDHGKLVLDAVQLTCILVMLLFGRVVASLNCVPSSFKPWRLLYYKSFNVRISLTELISQPFACDCEEGPPKHLTHKERWIHSRNQNNAHFTS